VKELSTFAKDTRDDKQCPKCKEWELNEMGYCNHCGYREPSK
jgi:hypothetical protein